MKIEIPLSQVTYLINQRPTISQGKKRDYLEAKSLEEGLK